MTRPPVRLPLGSCPDSWGVWFAEDKLQTPWSRFLDELADVGYEWLELGPYGYLPTDPNQLADELAKRNLKVSGGTVAGMGGPHRAENVRRILDETLRVSALTKALGAEHVIFVPVPGYRDDKTGAYHEPAELSPEAWRTLVESTNAIGKAIFEEHGTKLQFHPHADYHVETQAQTVRFLADTDPQYVNLCLDTGHLAYRRADIPAIIRQYPERIGYVHIKQMDPDIVAKAEAEDMAFGQAVAMGASCEPPSGLPDVPSVVEALDELSAEIYVIVEQDLYPVDFDVPKPVADRTRTYLRSVGIGVERP
jgi:inosose dehydratase